MIPSQDKFLMKVPPSPARGSGTGQVSGGGPTVPGQGQVSWGLGRSHGPKSGAGVWRRSDDP